MFLTQDGGSNGCCCLLPNSGDPPSSCVKLTANLIRSSEKTHSDAPNRQRDSCKSESHVIIVFLDLNRKHSLREAVSRQISRQHQLAFVGVHAFIHVFGRIKVFMNIERLYSFGTLMLNFTHQMKTVSRLFISWDRLLLTSAHEPVKRCHEVDEGNVSTNLSFWQLSSASCLEQ